MVGDGAADHVEVTAAGQRDHGDVVEQREPEALLDDRQGLPAQADAEGDLREVVGHQGDVGGFVGDIGAGDAHRHADVGDGEGGGVVDAVADHGDAAVLFQGFDALGFLFGQDSGLDFVDAEFGGDVHGDTVVVAGEHDDLGDAELPEFGDGRAGIGAEGVGDADGAAELAVVGDEDGGVAFVLVFADVRVMAVGQRDGLFGEEFLPADDEFLAGMFGGHAAAVDGELAGIGQRAAGFADDGAGDRVRTHFFGNGGEADEFGVGVGAIALDVGDFRLAVGEGAGLVEDDGAEPGGGFEVLAAFDEDAGARGAGNGGHDGGRRGENERAGAGDDEHGDRAVDVVADEEDERGEGQHDGDEIAGETVERALDRGFALLGGFDELGDAGQRGFFADAGGFDDQGAGFVESADEDFVAGLFGDRHAFAGDGRLVDGRDAAADAAIDGDAFAGAHDEDVADVKVSSGEFNFVFAATDAGGGRDEAEQAAEGFAGAPRGVGFELFAEEHDERDFPGSDKLLHGGGRDHRDGDEDIGVEAPAEQGFAGAQDDGKAGQHGGGHGQGCELEEPTQTEEQADAGGLEQMPARGAGLFGFAVGRRTFGFVAGRFDGGDQGRFVPARHGRSFRDKVDGGGFNARDRRQRFLERAGAAGAIHTVDLENHAFHLRVGSVVLPVNIVEGCRPEPAASR